MGPVPGVDMFRPPICYGMRNLDRSFFQKTVKLNAARVFENKNISRIRAQLEKSKDSINVERLGGVYSDPDVELAKAGRKCILLRPELKTKDLDRNGANDQSSGTEQTIPWPYSPTVSKLIEEQLIAIVPYELSLDYSHWTYHDIITSILPEEDQGEVPSGFSQVGHVAHLNLREDYLPYRYLIAEIIMDKSHGVRTVINKIDDVGEENEYRTFRYEVLAGPDDMKVEVNEEGCLFRFDYSKVYWNTRLNTEHRRIVALFNEGDAVCDVMAGIGPFAVPAGKRRIFVWANDLNPDSVTSLEDAIRRNKVGDFVLPFNEDGRKFIRTAAADLWNTEYEVPIVEKKSRKEPGSPKLIKTLRQPRTFQHFVLNLPASALTFLSSFVGLYPPESRSRVLAQGALPLIHVYCFSTKDELSDDGSAASKILAEISNQLRHEMTLGPTDEGGVDIFDVRDIAPKKRMFCASFRLPDAVAFKDS